MTDRKAWVLSHETKGTGAEMVPLDKAKGASGGGGALVVKPPKPPREKPAEPKQPPRFKVVDVLSRKVLAEGADAKTTVKVLEEVRSIVDVNIYLWQARDETWRKLSQHESRTVWGMRGRA